MAEAARWAWLGPPGGPDVRREARSYIQNKTNELRMSLFRHMMCWRRLRPLRFTRPRRRALTRAAQRSQYRNVATTCCRVCPARVPHPSSVVNGSSKPRVSFALACLGDVNAYVVCVCTCAWSALLERPSEASARRHAALAQRHATGRTRR